MGRFFSFSIICVFFMLQVETTLAKIGEWKLIKQKNGISVYRKNIEGDKVVAFKGQTIMNASINDIFWVLLDDSRRKEWVDRLVQSKVIEQKSPLEYVVYQEFFVPWPLKNRDFVYSGIAHKNPDTGTISLIMKSVEHPKAPKTVGVRADLKQSYYQLTPLSADRTFVEVEIYSDPKGLIPAWIVNLIQKNWPIKTLKGIYEQTKKIDRTKVSLPQFPDKKKEIQTAGL